MKHTNIWRQWCLVEQLVDYTMHLKKAFIKLNPSVTVAALWSGPFPARSIRVESQPKVPSLTVGDNHVLESCLYCGQKSATEQ